MIEFCDSNTLGLFLAAIIATIVAVGCQGMFLWSASDGNKVGIGLSMVSFVICGLFATVSWVGVAIGVVVKIIEYVNN